MEQAPLTDCNRQRKADDLTLENEFILQNDVDIANLLMQI